MSSSTDDASRADDLRERYLALLRAALTRSAFPERYRRLQPSRRSLRLADRVLQRALSARGLELVRKVRVSARARELGQDWPPEAETMIGQRRLRHLQQCIRSVVEDEVPGDLVETGVWRGGAVIFMRAALDSYGEEDRLVWAADSFCGLPSPDPGRYPADAGDRLSTVDSLRVPLGQVRANFARYEVSDHRVRYLEGWFEDTLPTAPIERIALLRLDGDMYGSTMQALSSLCPKVSPGGYVVVDDYALPGARAAVHDYRGEHGITEEIHDIDGTGAYWRRAGGAGGGVGGGGGR